MLHRRRTGELVGAGERVESRYGEPVVLSTWDVMPQYKRGKVVGYDVTVTGYVPNERNQITKYESYTLYELDLEYRHGNLPQEQ